MASKQDFFDSLVPSSIEPTPMPEVAVAPIDHPPRDQFVEVLERVGGNLGAGDDLGYVSQRAAELVGRNLQVLSLVEGVEGNRNPAAVRDPHDLKDIDYTIAPAATQQAA